MKLFIEGFCCGVGVFALVIFVMAMMIEDAPIIER